MKLVNTVIIRTHKQDQIESIIRAVQSAYSASKIIISPLIMCQGNTFGNTKKLEDMLDTIPTFMHLKPRVIKIKGKGDIRSLLLNEGIKYCFDNTDYISFLDCDDTLTSTGIEELIRICEDEEVSIAFGKVGLIKTTGAVNQEYNFCYDEPFKPISKLELLKENTQPIHSYVISTKRSSIEDLYFREEMSCLEDYEFLIRFISKYPSSFTGKNSITGMYYWREDGTNTSCTDENICDIKKNKWDEARSQLIKHRSKIKVTWFANDYRN